MNTHKHKPEFNLNHYQNPSKQYSSSEELEPLLLDPTTKNAMMQSV